MMLDILFEAQRNLNLKIAKENNLSDLEYLMEYDHAMTSDTRQIWLNNMADAMG